mgnify:CR=1 FL=1
MHSIKAVISGDLIASSAKGGAAAGIGAFTFVYAKGFSYLSTDPRACVNCHIMSQQYEAWLKSGDAGAAGAAVAKAEDGAAGVRRGETASRANVREVDFEASRGKVKVAPLA